MVDSGARRTDDSPLSRVSTRVRDGVLSGAEYRGVVRSRGSLVTDGTSKERVREVSGADSLVLAESGVEVRSRVVARTVGGGVTVVSAPDSGAALRARTVALPGSTVRTPASSGARGRPPRTDVPRDVPLRELSGLTSLMSRVAVLVRTLPRSASTVPGANAPSALRVETRFSAPDSAPLRTARLRMAGTSRTSSRSSDTLRNWAVRAEVATAVRTERACSRATGRAR